MTIEVQITHKGGQKALAVTDVRNGAEKASSTLASGESKTVYLHSGYSLVVAEVDEITELQDPQPVPEKAAEAEADEADEDE